MKKRKHPAFKYHVSYRTTKRFGIMNHVGGIWTPNTFESAEGAQKYLDDERSHFPRNGLKNHKVVPVRVTITPLKAR